MHHLERPPPLPAKNLRLEAIKSVGLTQLVHATQDLVARTRQPLFVDDPVDARGRKRPTITQTQKEIRLESALVEASMLVFAIVKLLFSSRTVDGRSTLVR